MLPATLEDLLGQAEHQASLLIASHPAARIVAPGWARFTVVSQRLFEECVGPRLDRHPMDHAVAAAAQTAYRARSHNPGWAEGLPASCVELGRITELLGTATDLLARDRHTDLDGAREVAARVAGIVATVSYVTATSERARRHEPMAFQAVKLQQAATRVLDVQGGRTAATGLQRLAAEPLSDEAGYPGPAPAFQTLTLDWARRSSAVLWPSSQTFALTALTLAQVTANMWQLHIRAANAGLFISSDADRQNFTTKHQAFRKVASRWRELTTAVPAPLEHRPAAAAVVDAARSLVDGFDDSDRPGQLERLRASVNGFDHLRAALVVDERTTAGLLSRGKLYLRPVTSRSESIGRPLKPQVLVIASTVAAAPLLAAYRTAGEEGPLPLEATQQVAPRLKVAPLGMRRGTGPSLRA